MVTREQLKAAADALGRLEALEAAQESLDDAPHDAMPISFAHYRDGDLLNEHGIKAYYPAKKYGDVLRVLIDVERYALVGFGVEP